MGEGVWIINALSYTWFPMAMCFGLSVNVKKKKIYFAETVIVER